ncbi:MAG: TlpA disulfide reductase family protein [Planctomycetia bacterium]|nr:TlpA disulfide reductase family protein [Planctomycetia bacterium]
MSKQLGLMFTASLVLVALLSCKPEAEPKVSKGMAPEINATDWLNTKPLSLKMLRGKIVVVEFWATWCGPCRVSIPHLIKLNQKYRQKGVVLISLTNEPRATVAPFAKKMNMDYPVGMGSTSGGAYGVRGIPSAFVIDPEGIIRWEGHPMGGLDEAVERTLKDYPPKKGSPEV